MITPRFQLSQDDKTFTITIRAPYCSLKELDVQVDEDTFLFYCKPYHLRITLPGKIETEDNAHSKFDSETGEFTFTYDKINSGETFPNLDFITTFLSPKIEVQEEGRLIEVVSETNAIPADDVIENEQQYGFAQRGGYKFNCVSTEFYDIFEIDPHEVPLKERKAIRLKREEQVFNIEHYMADYHDCEEINSLISQTSPWKSKSELTEKLTSVELDYLKNLPNIVYELSERQKQFAFMGLVDILYAYCFDQRTTCYESTCESGWTILKLATTLNSFEAFDTPKEAIVSSFRRALIYPLYRNFNLCVKVLEDLKDLIRQNETELIKVLIKIYYIFLGGDSARYILNHLFIQDYIIYVQKWDKEKWQEVVKNVKELDIKKADIGLDLEQIEKLVESDEQDKELELKFNTLCLAQEDTLDSDDSEESSTDSEDTTSSSTSSSSSDSDSKDATDSTTLVRDSKKIL